MDMNNRKAETRSDQKSFDLQIEVSDLVVLDQMKDGMADVQEINNKFTISLGDLRTEIESAKWDSVRRAMCKSRAALTSSASLRASCLAPVVSLD
jgi:hypothetical protein